MAGRKETVGEALAGEREKLLPLCEPFELEEDSEHWVDGKSRVVVRTNRYSVPVALVGRRVQARVWAQQVGIYHDGRQVAQHERLYGHRQERLQLDHHLELLMRKPGAMAGSRPLAQMRAEGQWPESYDRMWAGLKERYGESEGTRQMVELLMLSGDYGVEELTGSIEGAISWGCFDSSAVKLLMMGGDNNRGQPLGIDIGALGRYDRPSPDVGHYDLLLDGRGEVATA